jgi:predicted esterase
MLPKEKHKITAIFMHGRGQSAQDFSQAWRYASRKLASPHVKFVFLSGQNIPMTIGKEEQQWGW